MKRLRERAAAFHLHLAAIKDRTPLPGAAWYPWRSLTAMDHLDSFLDGDEESLRSLAAVGPVLDVGCADGDVAFFFESLGMPAEAVDFAPTNYNRMEGVRAMKRALGSSVGIHSVDLDVRPNLPGANAGLALLLGVLYHLKNPFLVLETLARRARHLLVNTKIASLSPDRETDFGALPMAYLVGEAELNHDPTNFWIFSPQGFRRILERSGWEVRKYAATAPESAADPVSPGSDVRAYILARSRLAAPVMGFRILGGWHDLEHGAWRWTEPKFSVGVESVAPVAPATLSFVFHLPAVVFGSRSSITLSASMNGVTLPPQTYTTSGEHEYSAVLAQLPAGRIQIDFAVDPAFRPGGGDLRELGVLVDASGAEPVQFR